MISKRVFKYLYDDIHVLYFGVWLDKTKVRLNLTRDNFATIDKESYTKTPSQKEILENWNEWKNRKDTLKKDKNNLFMFNPSFKFEKDGDKLVLSNEFCQIYNDMCLKNYDLNMKFINKLDKSKFDKSIDEIVKKYKMIEIINLKECKGKTGIYMAVLDEFKQLYIGQTIRDLKERILRHWKVKPKFDNILFGGTDESIISYDSSGALDTTRIFVIYETQKNKIDMSECQLVKEFPIEYISNRVGGGIHLYSIEDLKNIIDTMNLRKLKNKYS